MEKMTAEEILNVLEEKNVTWSDLGEDGVDWDELPFGKVKLVDDYGGEDCGSTYYKVYHFIQHDVYIRIDGWYSSYEGASFEESPYEVKPQQKTITVYER